MIAKYFNKPLQGKAFKIFSYVVMEYSYVDTFLLCIFQSVGVFKKVKI